MSRRDPTRPDPRPERGARHDGMFGSRPSMKTDTPETRTGRHAVGWGGSPSAESVLRAPTANLACELGAACYRAGRAAPGEQLLKTVDDACDRLAELGE